MDLQKTLFFLDFANINRAATDKNIRLDYRHLKEYMGFQRYLLDAYCYVPKDPRNEHKLDRDIEELQKSGFFIVTKVGTYAGETYKCDFDVEMAMDITKMAYVIRPEIVVLACGDSDLIPVVKELRRMGIRVEIAAFKSSMSKQLRLEASSFIDLDVYYAEEYLQGNESDQKNNKSETSTAVEFSLSEEEIDIATEIMDDAGLDTYIFEQDKRFTIAKHDESDMRDIHILKEIKNDLGTFIIFHTT